MKKATKILLIAGCVLVVLGLAVAAAGFAIAGGDFANLLPAPARTEKAEDFKGDGIENLVVEADYQNIEIVASADDDLHVTYYAAKTDDYSLSVDNATLTIKKARQPWWKSIGFFNYAPKTMTVAIPDTLTAVSAAAAAGSVSVDSVTLAGDLCIDSDAGAVTVSDISAGDVKISSDAGGVKLTGVSVKNVTVKASAGSVKWEDVSCGDADVDSDAGKVSFENVSCADVSISSDAGAVKLNNLTASAAKISTDAGKIEFTALAVARSLELSTDFGAIRGTVKGAMSDFTITSSVDLGNSNLPGSYQGGNKLLKVEADSGSVNVDFLQ